MSGISNHHGGTKTDVVETFSLEDLEVRLASTSLANIMDNVDRPERSSDFQLRYQKYLSKVEKYFKNGHTWTRPWGSEEKLSTLRHLENYQQFEEWILTPADDPSKLFHMHEKWLKNTYIPESQAVKIGHWTFTYTYHHDFPCSYIFSFY